MWEKEVKKVVTECWIRSDPTTRGYRKRMKQIWDEKGLIQANEQRIVEMIRVNGWLTDIEIEEITRRIESAGEQEHENEDVEQDNMMLKHRKLTTAYRFQMMKVSSIGHRSQDLMMKKKSY